MSWRGPNLAVQRSLPHPGCSRTSTVGGAKSLSFCLGPACPLWGAQHLPLPLPHRSRIGIQAQERSIAPAPSAKPTPAPVPVPASVGKGKPQLHNWPAPPSGLAIPACPLPPAQGSFPTSSFPLQKGKSVFFPHFSTCNKKTQIPAYQQGFYPFHINPLWKACGLQQIELDGTKK